MALRGVYHSERPLASCGTETHTTHSMSARKTSGSCIAAAAKADMSGSDGGGGLSSTSAAISATRMRSALIWFQ